MLHLSGHDLQLAIAQLDQAIYNHDQWYKNVQRVLIARLPPDASDLEPEAHRRCRFGQWYDSNGAALLGDHAAFAALGEAHKQMHAGGARILQRSADELPISVSDLDQFNNLLDRMRLEIESLRSELADTAQNRDPLTGARNRGSLLSDLREQQALVRRDVQACALVMIDLDHFKEINDRYGHAAGDAVLMSTAQCLQAQVRPYDRVYRYGGEEFLVSMPQTDVDAATEAADRLRAAVAAQEVHAGAGGVALQVTASFGVAALEAAPPVEESIDRADKALYQAKSAGRNRVEKSSS
jgi:diguanylate cyclase